MVTGFGLLGEQIAADASELNLQLVAFALWRMVDVLKRYCEVYTDSGRVFAVFNDPGVAGSA